MRKQTKRLMWVIFIVIVMFGSSFAFIIISVVPEKPIPKPEEPTEFIVDGMINQSQKELWISMGYTIMEFHYYENCCADLQIYVDALPEELNNQLVVEKIQDGTGPSMIAESRFGKEEKNVTTLQDVFMPLCGILTKPPADCGFMQLNITQLNITNVSS